MGRKEKFLKAKEAEERAARDAEKGDWDPIDPPEFLALRKNEFVVFRMVGNSFNDREKTSDLMVVGRTLIKTDDNKWVNVNWPLNHNHFADNDFILKRIVEVVGAYDWDKTLNGGKGGRVYKNDGCPLLKRILTNDMDNTNPSGWERPGRWVVANVIDRMDDWCITNAHTKLLAKEVREKNDKLYATYGISLNMYKTIWDGICLENSEHFEDFDIAVRRFKTEHPSHGWDFVLHASEDRKKLAKYAEDDDIDYSQYVISGDLTKEEENYERYDIENHPYFNLTSHTRILNALGKFIKKVDEKYKTDFHSELKELSDEEKKKWKAEKEEAELKAREEKHQEKPEVVKDTVRKQRTRKTTVEIPEVDPIPEFDPNDLDPEGFEGIILLSNKEKSLITGVNEEGILAFSTEDVAGCPECKEDVPMEMNICPYCATNFDE